MEEKKSSISKIAIILIIVAIVIIVSGIIIINKTKSNDSQPIKDNENVTIEEEVTSESEYYEEEYDEEGPLFMRIGDVFNTTDRGILVTGLIERGKVKVGDEIQIVGLNHKPINTTITGIYIFPDSFDDAKAGQNVSLGIKDVAYDDIEDGQTVIAPNSVECHTKFDAEIYVLTKDEGGRTKAIDGEYRPQFRFENTYAYLDGTLKVTSGNKIDLGETGTATIELDKDMAVEVGNKFSVREEDNRIVARGVITKVY